MWIDLIPNDSRQRVLCQAKGCDHEATVLHAELVQDGYRFLGTALCQTHAARSQDRSKPVLHLTPIRIVEEASA